MHCHCCGQAYHYSAFAYYNCILKSDNQLAKLCMWR